MGAEQLHVNLPDSSLSQRSGKSSHLLQMIVIGLIFTYVGADFYHRAEPEPVYFGNERISIHAVCASELTRNHRWCSGIVINNKSGRWSPYEVDYTPISMGP